jgi:adenine-specific DNA-methyltransferase
LNFFPAVHLDNDLRYIPRFSPRKLAPFACGNLCFPAFHAMGRGIELRMARGLAGFLNSTLFDNYFRQFSGHTQVNSTDLRQVLYPSKDLLAKIGSRIQDALPEQAELDRIVHDVLHILPETMSAFEATTRLDDAKAVLKR